MRDVIPVDPYGIGCGKDLSDFFCGVRSLLSTQIMIWTYFVINLWNHRRFFGGLQCGPAQTTWKSRGSDLLRPLSRQPHSTPIRPFPIYWILDLRRDPVCAITHKTDTAAYIFGTWFSAQTDEYEDISLSMGSTTQRCRHTGQQVSNQGGRITILGRLPLSYAKPANGSSWRHVRPDFAKQL